MRRTLILTVVLLQGVCICRAGDELGDLVAQLNDRNTEVAISAAAKLGVRRPVEKIVVPLLADRISVLISGGDEEKMSQAVVAALAEIGPDAKAAVPKIMAWRGRLDLNSKKPTIAALNSICPEQPLIVQAIDRHHNFHQAASLLLAELEPDTQATVSLLVEALGHSHAAVRRAACRALANLRTDALPAEAALIGRLKDTDPDVRAAAIAALGSLNRRTKERREDGFYGDGTVAFFPSPEVAPAIVSRLQDENVQVRFAAAYALCNADAESQSASVPALIEALKNREHRHRAAWALREMGPVAEDAIPTLRETMLAPEEDSLHSWTKANAAKALYRIASVDVSVPIYAEALQRETMFAGTIYTCLGYCGAHPQAVPILVEAATGPRRSPPSQAREDAIAALGRVRPADERAVDALIKVANGSNLRFRWYAISALQSIGKLNDRVLPTLVGLVVLPDGSGPLRERAADAIVHLGPDDATIDALIKAASHDENDVRRISIVALGEIGPAGKRSVGVLIERLRDEDPDVREAARKALAKLGPLAADAVPVLISQIDEHEAEAGYGGPAWVLSQIGAPAVPALIKKMKEDTERKQSDAHFALAQMGAEARSAVPDLIDMLRNEEFVARIHVVSILWKIGPDAATAMPKLSALRRSTNELVIADLAMRALVAIGEPSVPVFLAELDTENEVQCVTALRSLRSMGPRAKAAVMDVAVLLAAEKPEVRFAAAEALCAIDKPNDKLAAVVLEMLEHTDQTIRVRAISLTTQVADAGESSRVRECLLELLRDAAAQVRYSAAEALIQLRDPAAKQAVPVLVEMLGHPNHEKNLKASKLTVELFQAP